MRLVTISMAKAIASMIAAIAAARPGRRLAELESNHSVPMTRPADLVGVLREQLASITG